MRLGTLTLVAATLLAAGSASAQTSTTTTTTPATPAPATRMAPDVTGTTDLKAGANSFTESQARNRIETSGFSNLTDLAKDDQGIWRGKAMKDGKTLSVSLDFKGNVSAN